MAVEQLKYDFDLNLSKAEKSLDQFVNKARSKMDNISDGLEKKIATASGSASATRSLEQQVKNEERILKRSAERRRKLLEDLDRTSSIRAEGRLARASRVLGDDQKHAKALASLKSFETAKQKIIADSEKDSIGVVRARVSQESSKYNQQLSELNRADRSKGLGASTERQLREQQNIVEKFERSRRSRKEQLANISARAEMRSRSALDRIDWSGEQEGSLSKALQARKRYADSVDQIMESSSWKSVSTIRREVAQTEQIYKGALARIAPKNAASKSGGGFLGSSRSTSMAFNVQQMIEDYSYAGFRGLSNNLAFLGATLGGSAGLAIIAGVAAKGLWDLGKAMFGVGDAAELMEARSRRAVDTMKHIARLKAAGLDDYEKIQDRPDIRSQEIQLRIMNLMQEAENRRAQAVSEMAATDPNIGGAGDASVRAERFQKIYESLRKQLDRPNLIGDPSQLKQVITDTQKEVDALLEVERMEKRVLAARSKRRAMDIDDARINRKDGMADKVLDFQTKQIEKNFDRRTNRAVEFDRFMNNLRFKQMGGDQAGLRNRFDAWQEQRSARIRAEGEKASYNAQANIARQRAQQLRQRAEEDAQRARDFAKGGNMNQADRMFERSIGSYEKIMEMQESFMNKDGNPARQKGFFAEFQQFGKIIDDLMSEQARAHESFSENHGEALARLKEMEAGVDRVNAAAAKLEIVDRGDLSRVKEMNAELEKMAGLLGKGKGAEAAVGAGGGGGLFSIPVPGQEIGGAAKPLLTRAEAGAQRIAQIQAKVQHKFQGIANKRQEAFQAREAKIQATRERVAHERKEAQQRRLRAAEARPPKQPMKGNWNNPDAVFRGDPLARAQGYLPMIRAQVAKKEHDLQQITGGRWDNERRFNHSQRTGPLQDLRAEAGKLKNELDAGVTGRRAQQIADRFQQILKDTTDLEHFRPAGPRTPEKITPRFMRRDRSGNWTEGEGVLPPSSFGSASGINVKNAPSLKGMPAQNVIQNNNNAVNMVNNTVINTTAPVDAQKLARDQANNLKAARARMGGQ